MRTLRYGVSLAAVVMGAATLAASVVHAQQAAPADSAPPSNDLYPATLDFGTGLVTIPVAWIAPESGAIWGQLSGIQIEHNLATQPGLSFSNRWNTNLAFDTHWAGRFSVGLSVYSQNPEWGLFGQALLLKEQQGHAWPAIAVGFRNLGPYSHEDRYLVGHDIRIDSAGGTHAETSSIYRGFHSGPTMYAVATKSFAVGATSDASVSLGWGSGIFYENGGLGRNYNDKGTIVRGLFLGGRYALHPTPDTRIDFLAENNGWDWNAGVVGNWRGISLGIYGLELEEGGKSPSKGSLYTVYNYTKLSVSLGYSASLPSIRTNVGLRSRLAQLQRERAQLNSELIERQKRVASLEDRLRGERAGELAEVAKRRQDLEAQIQSERDAIAKAEARLKALKEGTPNPPPAKPPTPPSPR